MKAIHFLSVFTLTTQVLFAQKQPAKPWEDPSLKINLSKQVQLSFKKANPDDVVYKFIQLSGATIVKDMKWTSPVTLATPKAVTLGDAFHALDVYLKLLKPLKFEIIRANSFLVIRAVPKQNINQGRGNQRAEEKVLRTYKLQFNNAESVAQIVREVFKPAPRTAPEVLATHEPYSNSVIVNASRTKHEEVKDFIKQIDISTTSPKSPKLYSFKYAFAEDLLAVFESVLTAISPAGRGRSTGQPPSAGVALDERTNSLIVTTTAENHEVISALVKQLDQKIAPATSVFIISLDNAKAEDIAKLLQQAFGNSSTLNGRANVVPNRNTNSLVLVADPTHFDEVNILLREILGKSE